jgi:hypothetical protein
MSIGQSKLCDDPWDSNNPYFGEVYGYAANSNSDPFSEIGLYTYGDVFTNVCKSDPINSLGVFFILTILVLQEPILSMLS